MSPIKNPPHAAIVAMIKGSREQAARRITDPRNGDEWYWPAEQGTHAEGAAHLGVPYDRRPGEGDIVTL
ncbi:MAG: hypothetical protein MRY75_16080 [Marivita sp.]|uniref:hypothetical protein n=1 Tax=Marivita sp. TaxID=2003365 RepID=UPI0025BE1F1D|nr:hypothetical protein [Marivita sp.]MCI5112070.1 hypothetical protein [Marivita sp.]